MSERPIDIVRERMDVAPVPVASILRALGVVVKDNEILPENISGQISKVNGTYVVSSSRDEHPYRQRFTLAHELGHFVLHKSLIGEGLDDNKLYRSTADGNFYNTRVKLAHERQANSFAAKVLMPKNLLKAKIEELSELGAVSAVDLCRIFEVSRSALKWRLVNLGLDNRVQGLD